jgi:hypothetical protein
MSSYESSRSRRRGLWSYWVPVIVTVTVATAGVAAWAWSQRTEDEEEEEEEEENEYGLDYDNADYGENPPYGASKDGNANPGFTRERGASYGVTEPHPEAGGAAAGWGAHMSGALRRTPSPQQFLSNAGKTIAAGAAGVGAAVGSALSSIREEDKSAYADHQTWSQEAEARKGKPSASSQSRDSSKRRKTVAVVVSADSAANNLDEDGFHEHAVR